MAHELYLINPVPCRKHEEQPIELLTKQGIKVQVRVCLLAGVVGVGGGLVRWAGRGVDGAGGWGQAGQGRAHHPSTQTTQTPPPTPMPAPLRRPRPRPHSHPPRPDTSQP